MASQIYLCNSEQIPDYNREWIDLNNSSRCIASCACIRNDSYSLWVISLNQCVRLDDSYCM